MRNIFPGYHRKSQEEINSIWEKGIIVFDANVLLNLYRYSDSTRQAMLDLISKFSNQIFLPHQSALEYNRNRYEVIVEQEKAYKEFNDKIKQIKLDLQSNNKPPFLSEIIGKSLDEVFEKVNVEIEANIRKYCEFLKKDPIYENIEKVFYERVTKGYAQEELEEIFKNGEERFKNKIPPGYEDERDKKDGKKYGDLVLWMQIIDLARVQKKDVLLITDERKSDWWWKIKDGRNMGPRQELIQEIKDNANVNFHMYSSEKFLEYGQTFLAEQINKKAVDEIIAMKHSEMKEIQNNFFLKKEIHKDKLKSELSLITKKINKIDYILNNIQNNLNEYNQIKFEQLTSDEVVHKHMPEDIEIMMKHKAKFEAEKNILTERYMYLKNLYFHSRDEQ